MANSHLCITCGFDLARVRARPDPHYALPMVLCPGCGEAAVRRMHPSRHAWRTLLRVKTSIVAIALQSALLLGFTAGVVAVCVFVGERWARGILAVPGDEEQVLAVLAFGALPIALGAWLTAGLSHIGRFRVWLAFSILALLLISLDCVGDPLLRRGLETCGLAVSPGDFRWDWFTARLVVLIAIMTVATAGIPLGAAALAAEHRWRRDRWRARRRRIRARRTGR
jgi:hypothetical protein